jgi:hypothetical protein
MAVDIVVPCHCGDSPIFVPFILFAGNDEDDAQDFGKGAVEWSYSGPDKMGDAQDLYY